MEHTNEGLTIWYDTPDARLEGSSITIGVKPAHPANRVTLQYRVESGLVKSAPAVGLSRNLNGSQYFQAQLPKLPPDTTVEILPVLTCAGRQAPALNEMVGFSSCLRYRTPAPSRTAVASPGLGSGLGQPRFSPRLEFLGAVWVSLLIPPETIGETPQGLRKTFYVTDGACVGPRLSAKIRPTGADWMLILRDGVAIPNVRSTWETPEGALLYGEYSGTFDLGPKGYENALRDVFPTLPAVQLAPRFVTSHPKYLWINRVQCVAIGHVDMTKLHVDYDLYALRGGEVT